MCVWYLPEPSPEQPSWGLSPQHCCVRCAGDPSILRCRVLCGCEYDTVAVRQTPQWKVPLLQPMAPRVLPLRFLTSELNVIDVSVLGFRRLSIRGSPV